MNPLQQLEACGQAPWLDYLKRSFVEKGELKALVDRDGLKGGDFQSFNLSKGDRGVWGVHGSLRGVFEGQ